MAITSPSYSTLALLFLLEACGGGGGAQLASMPPPLTSPAPAPAPAPAAPAPAVAATDKIIGGATTSQAFATFDYAPNAAGGLDIAYDALNGTYLVASPAEAPATPLRRASNYYPLPGSPWQMFQSQGGMTLQIRASSELPAGDYHYSYSNLAAWNYQGGLAGQTAFGMATPQTNVPRSGSATYTGFIEGGTTETCKCGWDGETVAGGLNGKVGLTFDFQAGSLSGYVAPVLQLNRESDLGQLTVTNANWSTGMPAFSSGLAGSKISNGALAGTLTGPAAEELIGRLSFDYISPVDQSKQTAGGAFIAKR